jgi:hypothetical protein
LESVENLFTCEAVHHPEPFSARKVSKIVVNLVFVHPWIGDVEVLIQVFKPKFYLDNGVTGVYLISKLKGVVEPKDSFLVVSTQVLRVIVGQTVQHRLEPILHVEVNLNKCKPASKGDEICVWQLDVFPQSRDVVVVVIREGVQLGVKEQKGVDHHLIVARILVYFLLPVVQQAHRSDALFGQDFEVHFNFNLRLCALSS